MVDEGASYLPLYLETARQRVAAISSSLLALEKDPLAASEVENIFITAHTLKSESAMISLNRIAALAHALEDAMNAIKESRLKLLPEHVDTMLSSLDELSDAINAIERGEAEPDLTESINKLSVLGAAQADEKAPGGLGRRVRRGPIHEETVRTVSVPIEQLDKMMNLIEETAIARARLDALSREVLRADLRASVKEFDRLVSELEFTIMQSRLVPLSFIFERIPRFVRDLARREKKAVEVEIKGGDISLDKSVIDHLLEPLIHIIRNSVGHGITTKGTIKIKASRERDRVILVISDDGEGVDTETLKRNAVDRGLMSEAEARALSYSDALNLIFLGISTSSKVTDISGRGVGIKAVKAAIESLSGKIDVASERGKGTTLTVTLPLTLAIVKVMLVRVEQSIYALPSSLVEKSIQISSNASDAGGAPLIFLQQLFGGKVPPAPTRKVVIVNTLQGRAGLVVDEVVRDDEVIVKPLPFIISGIKYFQATTVLSDGRASLVVDIPEVVAYSYSK